MNSAQEKEMKEKLWYMGQHIGQLMTWCKRGDTHPGLSESAKQVERLYKDIATISPPSQPPE